MKIILESLIRYMQMELNLPILLWNGNSETLKEFQQQHLLNAQIQTMLSKEYLIEQCHNMPPNLILHIRDELNMELVLFQIDDDWIIVGPFTSALWDEIKVQEHMSKQGVSINWLLPYKLYFCSYQCIDSEVVIQSANRLIQSLIPEASSLIRKECFYDITKPIRTIAEEIEPNILEFRTIRQRYKFENEFMRFIKLGRFESAVECWRKMSSLSDGLHYKQSRNLSEIIAQATIFRTLCRKAAEQSGIPLMELDAITRNYEQKMYVIRSSHDLSQLMDDMVKELCKKVQKYQSRKKYNIIIRRAIEYIDTFLSQSLSIPKIAQEAGVSTTYLTKLFKQETGITIGQYIANHRTEKAAELLEISQLTIQEISTYVGYLDSNYFVKVFRSKYHMTPTEYRKKYTTIYSNLNI